MVVPAARTEAEDEAAEEDDGHDENGARDDPDPRGNGVQLAAAWTPVDVMRLDHGRGARRGVGGRRMGRGGGLDGVRDRFW